MLAACMYVHGLAYLSPCLTLALSTEYHAVLQMSLRSTTCMDGWMDARIVHVEPT